MRGIGARGWMRRALAVWLAIALALCAGGADAPGGRPAPYDGANPLPAAPGVHALRVALDPETGALGMPSADSPSAALQEPAAAPRVEVMPNGMRILHHDGHFRNYALASRDAAGRIHTDCAAGTALTRQAQAQPQAHTAADSVPRDAYGRVVR